MIVLADIPFFSERVEILNNSILSSKSKLYRLNDPVMVCVFGRPESSGGQRRLGALEGRIIGDIETPVGAQR